MTASPPGRKGHGQGLLLTGALVLLWGSLGWLDTAKRSTGGFSVNAGQQVRQVDAGGPAEQAGLRVGDVITHWDGFAVDDAAVLARLPRKRAGDTLHLTVERHGEVLQLALTYRALSVLQLQRQLLAALVGACFVIFPLLAAWRKPGAAARSLALMGLGLGLALLPAPWLADFSMRSLTASLTSLMVFLGVAALVQFLLLFPLPRPWAEEKWAARLLYTPAVAVWLLLLVRIWATPAPTAFIHRALPLLTGLVMVAYLLWALHLLLRNYSRSDRQQRRALALNPMMWGTVAAILPATVAQLVDAFSPQASLPGQTFYFVSLALLPMTWARSLSRGSVPPEAAD